MNNGNENSQAHPLVKAWGLTDDQEARLRLLVGKFIRINDAYLLAEEAPERAKALDHALAIEAEAMDFTFEQVTHAWADGLEPAGAMPAA